MRSTDRLLLRTARAAGRHSAGLLLVAVVDPLTRLAIPAVLALSVDAAVAGRRLWPELLLMCGVLAIAVANEAARDALTASVEVRGAQALRRRIVDHVLDLGVTARVRFGTGDLLGRSLESAAGAATVTPALVSAVSALLSSVGGLVALFLIDVRLGLFFLVGAPVAWWLLRGFVKEAGAMTGEYQEAQGTLSSLFFGALGGLRTVRASGTADREVDRVLSAVPRLTSAGMAHWAAQRGAAWRMGLLLPVLQIGVLALAGYGVLQGRVTHGELLAATGYLTLAMGLLKQVAILLRLVRARASAARVDAVLSVAAPPHGTRALPGGRGRLELRGVRVTERGRTVLSGVDLVAPPGSHLAIAGLPGAGKSALAEVAGGLLPADAGTVLLDGVPLDELLPGELTAAVTFVFERPVLFGETLGDALAYTDRPPTAERLRKGLRDAGAEEFTARLPEGLDTPLRDLRLSGGELQRLGLARAAGRDARLVIFDDALTGVDTATEAQINGALDRSMSGLTRIVVARRAATAAQADLVAWLDGGTLRALAPHTTLLREPAYRAVFHVEDTGHAAHPREARSGVPG